MQFYKKRKLIRLKWATQRLILCRILRWHKWTSAGDRCRQPTSQQLARFPEGFIDYAQIWCDRCGCHSKYNDELNKRLLIDLRRQQAERAEEVNLEELKEALKRGG